MNIFENAKFGDKFRTRDGRMAIYAYKREGRHYLIVEYYEHIFTWNDNGVSDAPVQKLDIVSEWQESIDEEELDRLAMEYIKGKQDPAIRVSAYNAYNAYRVGYRKAKEQSKAAYQPPKRPQRREQS